MALMTACERIRAARADFSVENHGSLFLVRPLNDLAHDWLEERTDGTWFGGALVVEPRYIRDLVDGIAAEGFDVR